MRNVFKTLFFAACIVGLTGLTGCGDEKAAEAPADTEHFLSDQQKALEKSKAAAAAMEETAAERARQTEDARNN
jgi:outer membrane murein-binding lipoprotein Lpp